jgi:SNF2 family DNA or RNA helicase
VILLSLKAANTVLNMDFANHVILLDRWWNPTVEDQAVDKAHRLGQKKVVKVYKIIMNYSIEEKILKLQVRKQMRQFVGHESMLLVKRIY